MQADAESIGETSIINVAEFQVYNRDQVLAMQRKEKVWEEELQAAMAASEVVSPSSTHSVSCPRLYVSNSPARHNDQTMFQYHDFSKSVSVIENTKDPSLKSLESTFPEENFTNPICKDLNEKGVHQVQYIDCSQSSLSDSVKRT